MSDNAYRAAHYVAALVIVGCLVFAAVSMCGERDAGIPAGAIPSRGIG